MIGLVGLADGYKPPLPCGGTVCECDESCQVHIIVLLFALMQKQVGTICKHHRWCRSARLTFDYLRLQLLSDSTSVVRSAASVMLYALSLWWQALLHLTVCLSGADCHPSRLRHMESASCMSGQHLPGCAGFDYTDRESVWLQTLLIHVVSLHVRSAVHGIPGAALMIQAMANTYNLYLHNRGSLQPIHTSLAA